MNTGNATFVCGAPEDPESFARIMHIEKKLFGGLGLPLPVAEALFRFRAEMFLLIKDGNRDVAAFCSVFPLKRWSSEALIAGTLSESELTPEMLLKREDNHHDATAYISSVVIDESYNDFMKANFMSGMLLWRAEQLKALCANRICAIMMPVSDRSEKMVRLIQAQKLRDGAQRMDGYPIYGRTITPAFW